MRRPSSAGGGTITLNERSSQLDPISERLVALRAQIAAAQAELDALMLEHCPELMTPEQLAEWGRHQRPVDERRGPGR